MSFDVAADEEGRWTRVGESWSMAEGELSWTAERRPSHDASRLHPRRRKEGVVQEAMGGKLEARRWPTCER